MIKQNIGILNALLRITCGLTYVAIATVRMIRRPERGGSIFMLIMAALKVAEGIVRYCPVTDVVKRSMDNQASAPTNNANKQTFPSIQDQEIEQLQNDFMENYTK
ncbi:YgaP family membrane protein [Aquibacillus sediminis]|uniref:YgaP family membrane protein n=1 Tax=Aquibacillus sediminis TaxID=2574734 RepID=UPI001FEA56A4|nr:DUF2892 domain-containing protein [Aquibacillus sediminis]